MNILFVERKLRTDKLGILYLSRILKDAGHNVDLVETDIEDVHEYMKELKPDFLMYSVMSGDENWVYNFNSTLKTQYDFITVVGGPHFTFFPKEGIDNPDIDYVVIGAGELIILDLVDGSLDGKYPIMGTIPDVESLAHPDRSIQYKYSEFGDARMKRFIAGRYCLYSCKYCFNHSFKRIFKEQRSGFFQRVSPSKMVDEILEVKGEYKLELVYFNDDDLAADKDWLYEFCTEFKERVGLEFCGSIRANSVTRKDLKVMSDAGCTFLNIALESAVPETQRFLRRGFITNEQIEEACKACVDFGIKVRLQNMIGLPVDDPLEDALVTLEMNQRINPTDSWAAIFQPYYGTDLWQYCLDNGLISIDTKTKSFADGTVLNIKDADKIDRLQKWWFFAIKYQFPLEFVKLLLEIPLDSEISTKLHDYRWEVGKNLLYEM